MAQRGESPYGVDIHLIHVRSKHEDALPLVVTHGWPGSVIEQLKIVEPLTNFHGIWRPGQRSHGLLGDFWTLTCINWLRVQPYILISLE